MPLTYGATFQLGQTFPEDGIFFRVTTEAAPPAGIVPQGIAAQAFRGPWGPLGRATVLNQPADVDVVFGTGGTTDLLREAFNGAADKVIAWRLGTGGAVASFTLNLSVGGAGLTVPLAYPGSRGSGFSYMLRDSLLDPTQRELDLYELTTLRASVPFAKGPTTAGGSGEAGALLRAIVASGSPWFGTPVLAAAPVPSDTSTLATVNVQTAPTVLGVDPIVTGSDYTALQNDLTNYAFNTLAIDTNDLPTLTALATYAMNQETLGKRFIVVLAEGTTVPRATRQADAKAFNNYRAVYFGNGFSGLAGVRDGVYAAAQLAARVASTTIGQGTTGLPIVGATQVLDPMGLPDYRNAIQNGMLVATVNQAGQVVWGEQVTTYLTPDNNHTPNYSYISVVRVYDYLQDAIYAAWDPLLRRGTNSPRRRRLLLAAANSIIARLVGAEAVTNAIIIEDPANPPVGRRAWFRLGANSAQPLEQAYVTLEVDFTGTTAAALGATLV